MMCRPVSFMLVMLSVSLAAPSSMFNNYPVAVPGKRAALVLDRILIALQKALHENPSFYERLDRDGPRASALRIDVDNMSGGGEDAWLSPEDLSVEPLRPRADDMTGLQRRGQASAQSVRGRVLRCYFNAITCF